ncbi:hypothetical protein GF314_00005 [bacterium]|nr:hypothetical protein [bacterium]
MPRTDPGGPTMTRAIPILLAAALTAPSLAPAATPDPDADVAAAAVNAFACDLYGQLAERHDGEALFFSPYSMAAALAMAAEGARGETAREMGAALRVPASLRRADDASARPWDFTPLHGGLAAIEAGLAGPDPRHAAELRARIATLRADLEAAQAREREHRDDRDWDAMREAQERARALADEVNRLATRVDQYELEIANALWVDGSYPLAPDYVSLIDRAYDTGGAFTVDFRDAHEAARRRINGWVADRTRDRIQDLLAEGMVDPSTRLVLTNAIYFKGR